MFGKKAEADDERADNPRPAPEEETHMAPDAAR
jgi:hypothetical protein